MSQFIVNQDMFGRYCKIKTDFSENLHTYKIVALIESNSYCDVPLCWSSKPTLHKDIVPVLLVIHCGIDETKVRRVALSDCEIKPIADVAIQAVELRERPKEYENAKTTKNGEWLNQYLRGTVVKDGFVSSCCDMWNERKTPFCPYCGAKMDENERNYSRRFLHL